MGDEGWARRALERVLPWARRATRGIVTLAVAGALLAGGAAVLLGSMDRHRPQEPARTATVPDPQPRVAQERPDYRFPYRHRTAATQSRRTASRHPPRNRARVSLGLPLPSPVAVAVDLPSRPAGRSAQPKTGGQNRQPRKPRPAAPPVTAEIACIGSRAEPDATSTAPGSSTFVPLYHLYDPDTDDHCYALNETDARSTKAAGYERSELLGRLFDRFAVGRDRVYAHGHTLGYVSSTKRLDSVALYRLWGPDGETVLTTAPERFGSEYHSPKELGYILR